VNLFLSQPSRVLNRLLDIFFFQVGIAFKNLVKGSPMSDLTNNHSNWYPHPTDTRPSTHDLGIKGNSIKHVSFLLSYLGTTTGHASQPLFFSLPRIQWRQGIRQTQEIRASILLSLAKLLKAFVLPLTWKSIAA
jgi:hypothetical protein